MPFNNDYPANLLERELWLTFFNVIRHEVVNMFHFYFSIQIVKRYAFKRNIAAKEDVDADIDFQKMRYDKNNSLITLIFTCYNSAKECS